MKLRIKKKIRLDMLANYITGILIVALLLNYVWAGEPELQSINVIFRHGHRTPAIWGVYPNDPYINNTFLPEGFEALTNKGKRKAYELGKILREKYDDFLGSTYLALDVFARSTDFDRTKMTLQLVLAGLYPPNSKQKWNKFLNWQPIPITYVPKSKDDLYPTLFLCKKWREHYFKVQKIPEVATKIASFDNLMKNISVSRGDNVTDIFLTFAAYVHLMTQQEMGLKLPSWTHDIFPSGELLNASLNALEISNYDDTLKKWMGGAYLRKISENILNVKDGSDVEKSRKIYLYSTHDIILYGIFASLNFKIKELPEFCSAIMVELLKKDEIYYVKVLYYLGKPSMIQELQIPNCDILCPLEDFLRLTKNVIPTDEELECE